MNNPFLFDVKEILAIDVLEANLQDILNELANQGPKFEPIHTTRIIEATSKRFIKNNINFFFYDTMVDGILETLEHNGYKIIDNPQP